jgi:hypothetical protein
MKRICFILIAWGCAVCAQGDPLSNGYEFVQAEAYAELSGLTATGHVQFAKSLTGEREIILWDFPSPAPTNWPSVTVSLIPLKYRTNVGGTWVAMTTNEMDVVDNSAEADIATNNVAVMSPMEMVNEALATGSTNLTVNTYTNKVHGHSHHHE